MSNNSPLIDGENRAVRYLRLSVTDRCNLDCVYCRGVDRPDFIPCDRVLRYEHMLRFAGIVKNMGVTKIRLTGGEPLVRKDCAAFMRRLRSEFPDLDLALTTNGVLLESYLDTLKEIRPVSVNVSLDSFNEADYLKLTGHNSLSIVQANISALLEAGIKVKINAVAIKGVTDAGIDAFLKFASEYPVDVRFIEFMPMGRGTIWKKASFLPASRLLELASGRLDLTPARDPESTSGPARMYDIKDGAGRLGFISALTSHFCASCNRLRLTSEGNLRTCLFDDREYRLGGALRDPRVSDAKIAAIVRAACRTKAVGARLLSGRRRRAVADGGMVGIGG
ncbi:MAG: GTP 3',8-cyclase MoaA [Desulfovibrio sp.]|nr:GTP 3',8-cyclase MoaA [Desulfovibrio sp.]